MPGYCTLTATARPSRVTARCPCPIDAAAMGCGSHRVNARSGGAPSSSASTAAASSGCIGGTLSYRLARATDGRGQPVVEVAGHLAEFHHDALHRAQGAGRVLGGRQGQVRAEQLALLARSRVEPRRPARIPEPAAREQPEGRKRAAAPQPPAPAGQGGPCQGRHDHLPGLRGGRGQTNHLLMLTAIRSPSPLPAWACTDLAAWPGFLNQLVY
jgi:hypothetical protein